MRKIRILSSLLALILCASMLLTACGNKDKEKENEDVTEPSVEEKEDPTIKLADIMNKDWKASADSKGVISKASSIDCLGIMRFSDNGFLISDEICEKNEDFPENSSNRKIFHVYNINNGKELLNIKNYTTTETKNENQYAPESHKRMITHNRSYIHVINDKYFSVLTMTRMETSYNNGDGNYYDLETNFPAYKFSEGNFYRSGVSADERMYYFDDDIPNTDDAFVKYSLVIYNAEGTAVVTIDNDHLKELCENSIYNFDCKSSNYNNVYDKLLKKYSTKVNTDAWYFDLTIDGKRVYREDKNGNNTLVKDYGKGRMPNFGAFNKIGALYVEKDGYTYTVYNKDLEQGLSYSIPGYSTYSEAFALADGSLLIQYVVQLDQNAPEFDYREGADKKYDLVTLHVTKDEAVELKDVNYFVTDIEHSVMGDDGQKYYSDSIENLAFISPISDNKMLDEGETNLKLVTLSNDCKTMLEVVSEEKLVDFPVPITDDLFVANVIGDAAVVYNENGEKQNELVKFDVYTLFAGEYFLEKEGIYDLSGKKVYDFELNAASYVYMNGVLFINYINDNGELKHLLWANGSTTEINGDVVDTSASGYYCIANEVQKEGKSVKTYTYFNANGKEIGTYEEKLSCLGSTKDYLIMGYYTYNQESEKNENKLYKFDITK